MLGTLAPGIGPRFEVLLWPAPATLLYTTFVQVPLLHVRDAFRDRRFPLAVLLGDFLLIPLAVWLILLPVYLWLILPAVLTLIGLPLVAAAPTVQIAIQKS